MKKRIVLCADDYGQAPAISQAIINLMQNNRLSATSCMVNSPFWLEHAKWLVPFIGRMDIGLHFNLTEGYALSNQFQSAYGRDLMRLSEVLRKSVLREWDQSVIEAEWNAQLDRFEEALGCMPDFIDGHQHVHQFPVIRSALVKVYQQRLRSSKTYVRLVNEKLKITDIIQGLKKIIIHLSGARALRQLLDENKIQHNQSFAGIYAFSRAKSYPRIFPLFLKEIGTQGLIMCHPGLASSEASDAISDARYAEYQYLCSSQFIEDCNEKGVVLSRLE